MQDIHKALSSVEYVDAEDNVQIWLDDEPMGKVEEADSGRGYILQWRLDIKGHWQLVKLTGKVRITLNGASVIRVERTDLDN